MRREIIQEAPPWQRTARRAVLVEISSTAVQLHEKSLSPPVTRIGKATQNEENGGVLGVVRGHAGSVEIVWSRSPPEFGFWPGVRQSLPFEGDSYSGYVGLILDCTLSSTLLYTVVHLFRRI